MGKITAVIKQDLRRDLVDLLYKNAVGGLFISVLASIILVYGFETAAVQQLKFYWLYAFLLVLFLRLVDLLYWKFRLSNTEYNCQWPYLRFLVGAVSAAMLWSSYVFLVSKHASEAELYFLFIIIAGMAGGAATILSGSLIISSSYSFVILFPASLYLALSDRPYQCSVGLLGLFFSVIMISSAIRSAKFARAAFDIKEKNQKLLEQMQVKQTKIKRINRQLKRQNNKLKKVTKGLSESEQRVSAIVNNISDALLIIDQFGAVQYANSAAEQLWGMTADALNVKYLSHLLASNSPKCELSATNLKVAPLLGKQFEIQGKACDGTIFPVLVAFNAMSHTLDGEEKILVAVKDLSQLKQAELEQGKLAAQLYQAQKLESVGTLAAGLAHDFNNILNSAVGYVELLQSECQSNSNQMVYLTRLDTALESAAALIKSLLGFSRKGKMTSVAINMAQLLEEVIALLARTIDKKTTITLKLADEPLFVSGDHAQLMQVFINLCLNAHQAIIGEGIIVVSIERYPISEELLLTEDALNAEKNYLRVLISDNGRGIPKENQDKIFDPFYTTKPVGEGSGLGLSSSYGIVKNHGGLLFLKESSLQGTTFAVILPCADIS